MSASVVDVGAADFQESVVDESHRRPVLVDFWADWCGPCKALAPILERVVEEHDGAIRLAKVDTQAEQSLAAEHGVRSLPTVRLFRDGRAVAEFMGAQPESAIREFLSQYAGLADGPLGAIRALADAGDLEGAWSALSHHLEEAPEDTDAMLLSAELSLARGDPQTARARLESLPQSAQLDAPARSLAARLTFAGDSGEGEAAEPGSLEQRYQQGLRHISSGQVEEGLDTLLAILREDRGFRDDGARKAMLEAFLVLGDDDPRVAVYRGKLFSLLH